MKRVTEMVENKAVKNIKIVTQ